MQIDKLLRDATKSAPSASRRETQLALVDMLKKSHGAHHVTLKGVEKWSERGTIPAKWLMAIAALRKPPLNLSNYN